MATAVLGESPIPVPQETDSAFVVPFCTYAVMTDGAVPNEVTLLFSEDDELRAGKEADDRTLVHENRFTKDEMADLSAVLDERLQRFGRRYDLFVVGDRLTAEDSRVLALFLAEK